MKLALTVGASMPENFDDDVRGFLEGWRSLKWRRSDSKQDKTFWQREHFHFVELVVIEVAEMLPTF